MVEKRYGRELVESDEIIFTMVNKKIKKTLFIIREKPN